MLVRSLSNHVILCLLISLLLTLTSISAASSADGQFEDGANSLFIGHSFFVPIAKSFDLLASDGRYSEHESQMVFAGGAKGSPGSLWNDQRRKDQIEKMLASGDIELFGMTTSSDRGGNGLTAYQRWIDLALSYNPDTVFLIGSPWVPRGPQMDAERFDQQVEMAGDRAFDIVADLRRNNPDTEIIFINYGKVSSVMRTMFEADELDDITKLTASEGRNTDQGERRSIRNRLRDRRQQSERGSTPSPNAEREAAKDALFADANIGHAGPMMTQLSALVWLHFLYGAEESALPSGDWNTDDVERITSEAIDFNARY